MHTLVDKPFEMDDFSHERIPEKSRANVTLIDTVDMLNLLRDEYLTIKAEGMYKAAKDIWYQMIQLLPSSFNQKRTVMLNYEVLANIYASRKNHKLDEWKEFCGWIETMPFAKGVIYEM